MAEQTVLIVDDEEGIRRRLRTELEAHRWSVLESAVDNEASELAKQRAPDLIILNASSTGSRGEAVVKRLKADPLTCAIPIVALTVTDRSEDFLKPWAAETINSGASLPVMMAKLQHALAKQKARKPHVLVIDDEPQIVKILTDFLIEGGVAASGASNGREALEVVRSVQPDAILLDLDMPHIDGWELLARLKANAALADIRVVILTGKAQTQAEQQRGKDMGASLYLLKPCDLKDVLRAIQLSLKEP